MKLIRFFLPRMEYILLAALFWSIAANGHKLLNFDGDLPRHLLVGQVIRETRSVSLTDQYSFRTEGFPSIPHEWLSQVIFSISNDLLGLSGVIILTALLVTLTWAMVYSEAGRRSNHLFINLFLIALGIGASMIHVLPRPHLFTYLFAALWILALERITKDKPKLWWLLPLMMVFWVNMHGMFILGIIIWGIYLVGSLLDHPSVAWLKQDSTRALLTAGVLSIVATFISPSGFKIWGAITSLGSNSYITSRIPEYQSANFHMPETWPFILLLILTMIGFARRGSQAPWTEILLTTAFAAIALYTSRMIPLFGIVTVPIAARSLSEWVNLEFQGSRLLEVEKNISTINSTSNGAIWIFAVAVAAVLIFQAGGTLDPQGRGNTFDERFFPVQAVGWLNSNPQAGHMFNEFDWGGYLLLKLNPPQQIFMDGHTHIYGEALTREYETVITLGKGWQEILDKYQVEWAIVRVNSPIAQALQDAGWSVLCQDETTVILKR